MKMMKPLVKSSQLYIYNDHAESAEVLAQFFSSVYVTKNVTIIPNFPPRSHNQINEQYSLLPFPYLRVTSTSSRIQFE